MLKPLKLPQNYRVAKSRYVHTSVLLFFYISSINFVTSFHTLLNVPWFAYYMYSTWTVQFAYVASLPMLVPLPNCI